MAQVPPDQRLANRPVVNAACKPGNRSTKPAQARTQAASSNPEICIVVVNNLTDEGKPTVLSGRKAAVPDAIRRAPGTPPGSESGACLHRGSSGTWESLRSPCWKKKTRRAGVLVGSRDLAYVGSLPLTNELQGDPASPRTQSRGGQQGTRERARSEASGEGV